MVQHYGVPIVALMVFACEIGVPTGIPIEIALLLVGSFAIHSFPMLLAVIGLVAVADVLGAVVLYLTARTAGVRIMSWWLSRRGAQHEEVLDRWSRRLGGHHVLAVFVVRLLPLVRMYISISSGLLRIRPRDFLLGAVPAAMIWSGVPLTLGYLLRSDVQQFAARYATISQAIVIAVVAIGAIPALAGWVQRGGLPRAKLRRGRSALSFAAATASLVYLGKTASAHRLVDGNALIALPHTNLVLWLLLLAGLALALLGVALADLRAAHGTPERGRLSSRPLVPEPTVTVMWLALVTMAGVIMIGIELRVLLL
jgi:membrane protein DedA with SNARE-associated domain